MFFKSDDCFEASLHPGNKNAMSHARSSLLSSVRNLLNLGFCVTSRHEQQQSIESNGTHHLRVTCRLVGL